MNTSFLKRAAVLIFMMFAADTGCATDALPPGKAGAETLKAASVPINEAANSGEVSTSAVNRALVFAEELRVASQKIMPAIKAADGLTVQGRFDEANALLLGTFPAATRSPVETFVLANVLFRAAPELSYDFHRAAARALPTEADVLLEWALEQHRAKDYSGAAKTYEAFSKLRPNYAPALGLAAECAIRRGKVSQAVELWKQSQQATNGTLQQLESMVCEVNGEIRNDAPRMALMHRAEGGDEVAAGEMLLRDCSWSTDWWNNAPSYRRLENDLALVNRLFASPGTELRAAVCTAECALQSHREVKVDVAALIARNGFLLDEKTTLPTNGKALSGMLSLAFADATLKRDQLREKLGDAVLERARRSKDAEVYRAAAFLYRDTEKVGLIEQEGWDVTHDVRFAASRVVELALQHRLALDDSLLQRALKEFPENSDIAHVAVQLAVETKMPVEPYLVGAIKAEYAKFSSLRPGADAPRPSAFVLQGYFALLADLPQKESSVAVTD